MTCPTLQILEDWRMLWVPKEEREPPSYFYRLMKRKNKHNKDPLSICIEHKNRKHGLFCYITTLLFLKYDKGTQKTNKKKK